MSLLATRMHPWVVAAPGIDKNMTRSCEYGAFEFFRQQDESGNSFITPKMKEKAVDSMGISLEIPVLNQNNGIVVRNVRACTVPANHNTSAKMAVTFTTVEAGFQVVPSLHSNNEISYEQDFNHKMKTTFRALLASIDQVAEATLSARKTQVFQDTLGYTVTGNSVVVPSADRNEFFLDLNMLMRANCYPGKIHVIGNAGIGSLIAHQQKYGDANLVNHQLEFAGKQFYYTNHILNEAGVFATAYAVEEGQVGLLTCSGRDHVRQSKTYDTEWMRMYIPEIGLPVDVTVTYSKGDASGVAGESSKDLICTPVDSYTFTVDIAFLVSYNSDPTTIAEPIIKFEIEAAAGSRGAIPVQITNGVDNPVHTITV